LASVKRERRMLRVGCKNWFL